MNFRTPFRFDAGFVARVDFVHDGKAVQAAAPFDTTGMTERDVWTLWSAAYIDVASPVEAVVAPTKAKRQAQR